MCFVAPMSTCATMSMSASPPAAAPPLTATQPHQLVHVPLFTCTSHWCMLAFHTVHHPSCTACGENGRCSQHLFRPPGTPSPATKPKGALHDLHCSMTRHGTVHLPTTCTLWPPKASQPGHTILHPGHCASSATYWHNCTTSGTRYQQAGAFLHAICLQPGQGTRLSV